MNQNNAFLPSSHATPRLPGSRNGQLPYTPPGPPHPISDSEMLAASAHQANQAVILVETGATLPRGHRILYVNRAFTALTGFAAEEAVGQPLQMLQEERPSASVLAKMQQAFEAKTPVCVAWLNEHKDGSTCWVENSLAPVFDAQQNLICWICIQRDITEKKKLNAQLLQAQRMASIGMLTSGIAHDINNLLNSVLMACNLLEEQPRNEPHEQFVRTIKQNAQRGADVLKQVLTFVQGTESDTEVIQTAQLIHDVKHLLRETFPRSITIRTELDKDLWNIRGNPTQLEQVLINLSVNARDAMAEGGTLHITAGNARLDEEYARLHVGAKPGPYTAIKVSDTGKGIPADELDKIFEPFYTTKQSGKGTGLGLSIVRSIVESQDGFTHVYSEVGNGTTFIVFLPGIETKRRKPVKNERPPLARGHGELILLADDEESILALGKAILQRNGFKVLTARNGKEAVNLYRQHQQRIRVVITDIMMPIMDGFDAIEELVAIDPEVKILAMSGFHHSERLVQMAQAGAHAFLPKPFTKEHLLMALRPLLDTVAGNVTPV